MSSNTKSVSLSVNHANDQDTGIDSDDEHQLEQVEISANQPSKSIKRPMKQLNKQRKKLSKFEMDPNHERVFGEVQTENELTYRNRIGKSFQY